MKVITIGRSTEHNDIVVNDEKVSRNHLQMVMDDNGNYSVVDLGSTNGTFVNGQRISGEVRLQQGDEVKIGQTVLPWQNYFVSSSKPPVVNPPLSPRPPKGPNRTWLYVIIGAALLLLIGGGVSWKIYHDKQKEKIEQEQKKKEQQERQLEQEANDARVEAARLSEEAETAARKAAESQSKEDLKFAKEMKEKAEEANRLAKQKDSEWKKMGAELNAAKEAQEAAEKKSEQDAVAKKEAESKAEQARQDAEKAKQAQIEAETKAELTKDFYVLISSLKPKEALLDKDYYKMICDELGWKPEKKADKKAYIEEKFNNANTNAERQQIINAINKVKGQQSKDEKVANTNDGNNNEQKVTEEFGTPTIDTINQ